MIPGLLAAALGIWLMAAPGVIGYDDPAAASHHIIGPLIASFAVISIWESTRDVRRLNLLLAAPLALETVFLDMPALAVVNSLVCAVLAGALALVPAPISEVYRGGWRELLDWRRREGQKDG